MGDQVEKLWGHDLGKNLRGPNDIKIKGRKGDF